MKPEPDNLRGLQKICRIYGGMKCGNIMYLWDYHNEEAVKETDMPEGSERWIASEKAKYQKLEARQ